MTLVAELLPTFQHLAKHTAGIITAVVGAFCVFVIDTRQHTNLGLWVVAEAQAVLLEKLGAKPVLVVVA